MDLASGGKKTIDAKKIVIAAGSIPIEFPGVAFDEDRVLSSTGALSISKVPKDLLIIGGGIIGLELGSVWNSLGSNVTIIEYTNKIGGTNIDNEISY